MEGARRAAVDDRRAIVELAHEAIEELRPNRGGAIWSVREAHSDPDEIIGAALSAPGDRWICFVGTIDEAIVGYTLARQESLHDGRLIVVIDDIYVEPGARGVGVGEAMLDELVDEATRRGAVGVDGIVLPGDRHTKNFFESFGLKARAIIVHREIAPEDASGPDDAAGER